MIPKILLKCIELQRQEESKNLLSLPTTLSRNEELSRASRKLLYELPQSGVQVSKCCRDRPRRVAPRVPKCPPGCPEAVPSSRAAGVDSFPFFWYETGVNSLIQESVGLPNRSALEALRVPGSDAAARACHGRRSAARSKAAQVRPRRSRDLRWSLARSRTGAALSHLPPLALQSLPMPSRRELCETANASSRG